MRRYIRLYGAFLAQWLKVLLDDRVNLLTGVLSMIVVQAAGLLAVWAVMSRVPSLGGWRFEEVLVVYGLLTLARSLNQMLATSLWDFAMEMVRSGSFDRFLVRPVDPLFHLLANRFNPEGLGNFLVGAYLVVHGTSALGIAWTLPRLLYLVVAVLSGGLILIALSLIAAVPAFWMRESLVFVWTIGHFENFAKYPLLIYRQGISTLLTWVLPLGFVSYYPAEYLVGRSAGPLVWLGPVVAVSLFLLGYRFWRFGLRFYTGTGT